MHKKDLFLFRFLLIINIYFFENFIINKFSFLLYMKKEYYEKYVKYKLKYHQLKKNIIVGGGKKIYTDKFSEKFNEILNFIKTSPKEKIKMELYNVIRDTSICPKILGEGYFGKAYIPEINKVYNFFIGKKEVELPIVIKESKNINNPQTNIGLDIIENVLYISGYDNITTEALILMYIKELRKYTVNLPLILGYGVCSSYNLIDRIITYRQGLKDEYTLDLTGKIYDNGPLWHKPLKEPTYIFKSYIGTLKELFQYITYNKNSDNTVILPNNTKCDISELFDYLCISYLANHELLAKNNIIASDMHSGNIFIHWLNENSYFGEENIKNIKEIIYFVNNKYFKIKTFGLLLILGDVGTFIIKIRGDVILIGQASEIFNNFHLIKRSLDPNYTVMNFILWNKNFLTPNQFKKTIACKIIDDEPYASYPQNTWHLLGDNIKYLDKLKSATELLDYYYDKYGIDNYTQNKNNILIKVRNYNIL